MIHPPQYSHGVFPFTTVKINVNRLQQYSIRLSYTVNCYTFVYKDIERQNIGFKNVL